MSGKIEVHVNGRRFSVPEGVTVAVALSLTGHELNRRSVSGQPRGPLCGMGICFECRVTIDFIPDCLGCQTLCQQEMQIETSWPTSSVSTAS